MTSTSQDDDQTDPVGSEPTKQGQSASTDDKQVPLGEHIEQRQDLRDARARIEALEKQLAEASKVKGTPAPTQEPTDLAKQIRDLQRRDTLRELKVDLGIGTKQAEAILGLMDKMPGLSGDEARTLASVRDPGLFEADGSADGFQEGVHGASRPRPGAEPVRSEAELDTPQRLEAIKKLMTVDKRQANKLIQNLIGSIAAKQVGKPGHQRLPIPKFTQ